MDQKVKRNRGTNFTKEEELLLLSEVEKYKQIIECKMSDKINSFEKNEAWRKVVVGFNSKNGSHRNLEQLKIKYDNLKCKTRKVVAANKQYVRGTGGGPAGDTNLDPVIEHVLRIINKTTVVGHETRYDCDDSMDNDIDNEPSNTVITVPHLLVEVESQENLLHSEETSAIHNNIVIVNNENVEESCNSQQMELPPQEVVVIASAENNIDTRQLQVSDKGKKRSWAKYTPRNLKTPMSHRLRPTTVKSPQKDLVYKKKIELMEEEIKKSRIEQEAIKAKEARDVEEHKKKMRLMDLDIKLKEKMLEK